MNALNPIEQSLVKNEVIEALRQIYDPEIPVNIYDLGLIYEIDVSETGSVHVLMTLTSPMCPVAETLPIDVENAVAEVRKVREVKVDLTWDPPFSLEMVSEDVKLMLGLI